MKLAVLAEAQTLGRGTIIWYLKTFFFEEEAYDDPDVRYFHVRDPFTVLLKLPHWIAPKEIEAMELTYSRKRPIHLKAWVRSSNGNRSTPLSANLLDNFGELIEIQEVRKVNLPEWTGG